MVYLCLLHGKSQSKMDDDWGVALLYDLGFTSLLYKITTLLQIHFRDVGFLWSLLLSREPPRDNWLRLIWRDIVRRCAEGATIWMVDVSSNRRFAGKRGAIRWQSYNYWLKIFRNSRTTNIHGTLQFHPNDQHLPAQRSGWIQSQVVDYRGITWWPRDENRRIFFIKHQSSAIHLDSSHLIWFNRT